MNQIDNANDIKNSKKWKILNEKERYNIKSLLNAGYKAKEIAEVLNSDRRNSKN